MGKKNPFVFTIGFDKSDPGHVYVTELLNTTEKKAKLIVAAILAYTGRTDETGNGSISMEPDMLRPMMQQIIREEVRKVLEGQDVSKINREMPTEVDLMEEEPLRMDQTMRQNVVDAISAFPGHKKAGEIHMLMAVYSPVLCIRMGIDRKLTDYSQITHRLSLYNV